MMDANSRSRQGPWNAENPIKLVIIDDHPAVVVGLSSMLSTHEDLRVVATFQSTVELSTWNSDIEVDVVLLDLRMPNLTAAESLSITMQRLRHAKILVISSYETDEEIHRSLTSGAAGFITKSAPQDEVVASIRKVASGRRYLSQSLSRKLASRIEHSLTSREVELLHHVARGSTNKQIAELLELSEHTVRNHVNSIIGKMGVQDRTEASVAALKRGIINLDTL